MRNKQINTITILLFSLIGSLGVIADEKKYISITEKHEGLLVAQRVSIREYIKTMDKCEEDFTETFVAPINDDIAINKKLISEHWIVVACGKKYNFRQNWNEGLYGGSLGLYEP